ncbi:MAG: 3-methyl-2-oxobutanoate hydroxymethyltransferase [Elusimicrobiota bacterium]|nr:3-methyl-2-oxobutanoate hydroxymethyltransferase [Elusimicrobiota bacterium]
MKINDFYNYKKPGKKISMITAYDYSTASIVNDSDIDCVLVGDSLAMTMHGDPSTILANTSLMALHTKAVRKAIKTKLLISDMPFLSFRKGITKAMETVEELMKAGADAVKLEGIDGHEDAISHIIKSDIPVMGHLGLTPQSVNKFGGYKVQGKDEASADLILRQAKKLQDLGCFSIVLECVPENLSKKITGALKIPVIGIGAGPHTDGQVLVIGDMLGLYESPPSFVKKYIDGRKFIKEALNSFNTEIKNELFPVKKKIIKREKDSNANY